MRMENSKYGVWLVIDTYIYVYLEILTFQWSGIIILLAVIQN